MSLSEPGTSATDTKGKVFRSQARNIILKVYSFFKELSSEEVRDQINFSQSQELTAKACNVSVHTVSHVVKERKVSNTEIGERLFKSPGKHARKQKSVSNLDDFEKDALRRVEILEIQAGVIVTKSPAQMGKELLKEMQKKGGC